MEQFDVPVVLFLFKREKAVEVIKKIGQVQPKKVYLLADNGRNDEEKRVAAHCRAQVEAAIDWDCEVVKNYAEENRGVYENIGEGAKWVLRQEKYAIFLEDDNLPEVSFFRFCKEMLQKYEPEEKIVWICGTNYLGDYQPRSGDSYVFTKHMLPCGWASWGHKFEKNYDGRLELCKDSSIFPIIEKRYCNKKVYKQYRASWLRERDRIARGERPISWDYQMDFSIKAHDLLGICPCKNQIKNIGVDEDSIHGGNSYASVMTRRFCGMDSYALDFPLRHPKQLLQDKVFEKKIGRIILYPFGLRCRIKVVHAIKRIFRIPEEKGLAQGFKEKSKK